MVKKLKNIVLTKKKTRVEFKDVDGWIFDLRYLVNGKETYSCQIIKTDIERRINRLKGEGFEVQKNEKKQLKEKRFSNGHYNFKNMANEQTIKK